MRWAKGKLVLVLVLTVATATGAEAAGAERSASVALRLLSQLRATGSEEGAAASLALRARRIRPIATAELMCGAVGLKLHLSAAPGALELIDLYADLRPSEVLTLRVGQAKVPFTAYRAQSFMAQLTADWSPVTRQFGAERQWGVTALRKITTRLAGAWRLAGGVHVGKNVRRAHATGLAIDVNGLSLGNASSLVAPSNGDGLRLPELFARVGWASAGYRWRSWASRRGQSWALGATLSAALDLQPDPARDHRQRVAIELGVQGHGLSAHAAGYLGGFATDSGPVRRPWQVEVGDLGLLAQVAFGVAPRWELVGSFSAVRTTAALRSNARALADARAGAAEAVGTPGAWRGADEVTLALNHRLAGDALKVQLDTSWLRVLQAEVRRAWRARLQLQVGL